MVNLETYPAIGFFKSNKKAKLQAARQGIEDEFENDGLVELNNGYNYEQALEGLEEFSHVWIIFEFHQNKTWKPKVQPPRYSEKKLGVFATRAPYRPNQIGLTLARIQKISGRKIYLSGTDILDASPVLDIKPYLPTADAVFDAKSGWVGNPGDKNLEVIFSSGSQEKLQWIRQNGTLDLESVIRQHLKSDPFNDASKRVRKTQENGGELSIRKWRIQFILENESVEVRDLTSGYKKGESPHSEDSIHLEFLSSFPQK